MKEVISITAKNFYDSAWINVIEIKDVKLVMPFMYRTKKEAVKEFPNMVKKENRKIVKVMLVEF